MRLRFKTGLVIGLGVGYVLGAKAGLERYEQILGIWRRVNENPRLGDATAKGKAVFDQSTGKARSMVSDGISEASERIRSRAEANGDKTSEA